VNGSSLDGVESRNQLRRSGNSLSGVASMIGAGIQHQHFPRLADMAEVARLSDIFTLTFSCPLKPLPSYSSDWSLVLQAFLAGAVILADEDGSC
jgi:hypothetical protein